jgi:hypothetical protein
MSCCARERRDAAHERAANAENMNVHCKIRKSPACSGWSLQAARNEMSDIAILTDPSGADSGNMRATFTFAHYWTFPIHPYP